MLNYDTFDNTPLLYEETTELYYLDKNAFIGKLLAKGKEHPTDIEEVFPDDFLYSPRDLDVDSDDYEWSLTYQFSSDFRDPYFQGKGQYGNPQLTFRRLYVILSEHFNNGDYFIDDYFASVYPYTMKERVEEKLKATKEEILDFVESEAYTEKLTKSGRLNYRYKVNKAVRDIIDSVPQYVADELAEEIKSDMESAFSTGRVPLNFSPSGTTLEIRNELGIDSSVGFYATGQLLNDIRIFFSLERKGWQTHQGIRV